MSRSITKLMMAAQDMQVEAVRQLLARGAPVDARDPDGRTALHRLLGDEYIGEHVGADTHIAAASRVLDLLLEHGADPNASEGHDGFTPLLLALKRKALWAVRRLLAGGADPNRAAANGWTPLTYWASGVPEFPTEDHSMARKEALLVALLEGGADIDAPDAGGRNPLLWAIDKGADVNVRLLLGYGAERRPVVPADAPHLRLALPAAVDDAHALRAELEMGEVETEAPTRIKRTPLICAAAGGCADGVRLLLERGADISVRDLRGASALDLASLYGHLDVVRALTENPLGTKPTRE